MLDVLIVGGGVVGAAIARQLCQYDLKIALLEKEADLAMGATKANSAIVHGGYAEPHTKLKGRLCYQGRRQFSGLNQHLNFGFKAIGSLVLGFEEEDRAGLESLLQNGLQNGLPDLEMLTGEQVRQLEPKVSAEVKYALYCKGAGVCSPFEMAIAMVENAVANGLLLYLNQEVQAIQKQAAGGFKVQTKQGELFTARFVVNAAGLNSARVAKMGGAGGFTVHPRSGEYIVLAKSSQPLVNRVLFQMPTKMGKGILFTPTVYGNYMIGPDAIDEIKDDRDTHVERLYSIYKQAQKTYPELPISSFIRSYAGVRAVSSTDDFIIEETLVKGFVNVAGIQSPGLTSSPAIAQMVRDILSDGGLDLKEKPDFSPYREPTYRPHPPLEPVALARQLELPQGSHGRMVCRCEQVAERTILDAAARGIPVMTVDGVKRRTRAGMGPCQGAYCRKRVLPLLEQVNGVTIDSATDAEQAGLRRVNKAEMLNYIKQIEIEE